MNEPFYQSPVPQPRVTIRGGGRYRFRQPQTDVNPMALRRMQLQEVTSQRREEIAVGHQELEAMKEMARLEQQEYSIRQNIAKERQVSSAQREVAKLNPETDPHYAQSYAEVMAKHPMAQTNKFLNEAFTEGSRINYRVAQHKFNELEEGQKQAGKEELAWIKASSAYATAGGDPSAFTDKDGTHDWNALNAAHAKAVNLTKESAAKDNAGLPITKTVTKEGDTTVTREAAKPAKGDLTTSQKINIAKMEGTHAGLLAQQEFFQKQKDDPAIKDKTEAQKNLNTITANLAMSKAQMDAVHGVTNPQPPVTKASLAPGVSPAASAAPTAVPPSSGPKPESGSWDDLTNQMDTARGNADAARSRRMSALDTLTKVSFTDAINPFNTSITDAQKVIDSADAEIDKHDTTYKELFDKRGAMIKTAAPVAPVPPADSPITPTPVPAATPAPEKPPLSDLIKF